VHAITLLGDAWLNPGPLGVLVPFTMDPEPLFTGLGIVAAYLAALLGLSFYVRRRIGMKRWRSLRRLTLLLYVLAVAHTLDAGDRRRDAMAAGDMVLTGTPILFLAPLRLLPDAAPARRRSGRSSARVSSRCYQRG
jgi:sulfoxide reductase heme-binding subunit YedZ